MVDKIIGCEQRLLLKLNWLILYPLVMMAA